MKVLRKKEEGRGEKEHVPLSVGSDLRDLEVSPGAGQHSHCGVLTLTLITEGCPMVKFNREDSKQHSNLVSLQ